MMLIECSKCSKIFDLADEFPADEIDKMIKSFIGGKSDGKDVSMCPECRSEKK